MRMIALEHIQPGMKTAASVFAEEDSSSLPLVAGHVIITEALRDRLERAGVLAIPIEDEFSEGINFDEPITDETRRKSLRDVRESFRKIRETDGVIAAEDLASLETTVGEVLAEIAGRRNMLVALSDLSRYGGGRLHHAVNTAVMGLNIARSMYAEEGWRDYRGDRRTDRIPERLQKLGVGLVLLDVGALWVPEEIWNKHGILTADERNLMQEHPNYGVEMLRGGDASPLVTVTVAQHHERHDGSGYPRGLASTDIHDNAQIAAIADQYLQMTTETSQGPATHAPHEAYRLILQSAGRLFSPAVVKAFRESTAPFGPGTSLRFSDDTFGILVENSPHDPLRPLVRITHGADQAPLPQPRHIDLGDGEHNDLSIVAATGGLPTDA